MADSTQCTLYTGIRTRVLENICDAISLMSRERLTNEVLGYPRDARLLIINCDDFGMCFSQNIGTIRSIETGIARGGSLIFYSSILNLINKRSKINTNALLYMIFITILYIINGSNRS